jgi:hypothetical protein
MNAGIFMRTGTFGERSSTSPPIFLREFLLNNNFPGISEAFHSLSILELDAGEDKE